MPYYSKKRGLSNFPISNDFCYCGGNKKIMDKLVLEGEWCGIEMEEYGEIKTFTTIGDVIFEDAVDNFLNISSKNGGASGIKVRVTIERI